ncbi:MAG: hypothetical protein Q7K55_04080 [Candidatus Levybacteria bacterium]|nr:hypothetical protein [Candidatus Levybacteria bacterium]
MKKHKKPSEILKEKLVKVTISEKIVSKPFNSKEFAKRAKEFIETFTDEDLLRLRNTI